MVTRQRPAEGMSWTHEVSRDEILISDLSVSFVTDELFFTVKVSVEKESLDTFIRTYRLGKF